MINFKPELVKALKKVQENITESYPDEWKNLPVICYEEEQNIPHTITSNGESMTTLRYRIDIYSNTSTSNLKIRINEELTKLGLTRVGSIDMNDLAGRRHTVMRYEGVIDLDNNKIYKL